MKQLQSHPSSKWYLCILQPNGNSNVNIYGFSTFYFPCNFMKLSSHARFSWTSSMITSSHNLKGKWFNLKMQEHDWQLMFMNFKKRHKEMISAIFKLSNCGLTEHDPLYFSSIAHALIEFVYSPSTLLMDFNCTIFRIPIN